MTLKTAVIMLKIQLCFTIINTFKNVQEGNSIFFYNITGFIVFLNK